MHENKKVKLCGSCFVVHPSESGRQDTLTTVSVDWQYKWDANQCDYKDRTQIHPKTVRARQKSV